MTMIRKTQAAIDAFNRVQLTSQKTKKVNYLGYYPQPSPELKAKREYMQSDEFLKDPHNVEMFRISDWLMQARDAVSENIDKKGGGYKQAVNGYTRIARELEQNPQLNFDRQPSHSLENDMRLFTAKNRLHDKSNMQNK